jgi:hypothetical protein
LLTLGNVGQLAVDLMCATFQFERVGQLETPYVLPLIGNDTFTAQGSGILSTALEVFQRGRLTFVQQRTPVIKVSVCARAHHASWEMVSLYFHLFTVWSSSSQKNSKTIVNL